MINPAASPYGHDPLTDDGTDINAVDNALIHRARTSADVLTGLITAGLLHHAARVDRLPALLFPDTDPATVQRIWDTAIAVGHAAGLARAASRWDATALDLARTTLTDAGYTRMAKAVEGAAYAAPSRKPAPAPAPYAHPADTTTARPRP